jgi:5'-phosphate synthase pdxT subunit
LELTLQIFLHLTALPSAAGRSSAMRIGVLAFQGDVREHLAILEELGVEAVKVRRPDELASVDGLIIPGGESSVMDKLTRLFGMAEPLKEAIADGLPVFGTCAGLIMLSDTVLDAMHDQKSLGGLDVVVRRNAFGTQVDSFEVDLDMPAISNQPIPATFIRAPIVESLGRGVRILASVRDGRIVAVEQGNIIGISFHPEVNGDSRIHEYFLRRVKEFAQKKKASI